MRLDPHNRDQSAPVRTCAGCGQRDLRHALIRVVAENNDHLRVDLKRKLPGRGAWVHPAPDCVAQAQKRRAFPRMLKINATIGNDEAHEHFWKELAALALSEAHRAPEHE